MRSTLTPLLFLYLQISLALSLQIGNIVPKLVKDVSSSFFGHSTYLDQRVHQDPRSFLNHEQWHHRHVVAFTNASSIAYVTLSAPTRCLSTKSQGSLVSSVLASANSSGIVSLVSAFSSALAFTYPSSPTTLSQSLPSVSATVLQETSLVSLLGPTEDLETDKSADWDDETESACSTALIVLHGIATNPSGIAACYNIQSLVNSTGIFKIDLRLYRISAPREGWVKLDPSSVGVGLSYVNATVSATKARKTKREDQTLLWFPAQRDEAADIYIRRSTGIPPRRLERMTFMGTVDDGPLAELENM